MAREMAAGKYSHPMGHIWVLGNCGYRSKKEFSTPKLLTLLRVCALSGMVSENVTSLKGCNAGSQLGDPNWLRIESLGDRKKLTCQSSRILRNYTSIDKPECQTPKSPPYSKHVYIVSIHVTGFVKKPATSSCTTSSELRDGGPWRSRQIFFFEWINGSNGVIFKVGH